MNYELALKLKNAGFPQIGQPVEYWQKPNGGLVAYENPVVFPTLSELIEACEPGFTYLMKLTLSMKNEWLAKWEFHSTIQNREFTCKGVSKEEAVANLWLELNKK